MKQKLLKVGGFILKYIISPVLAVLGVVPLLLGSICSAVWIAFLAGWNATKQI